MCAKLLQCVLLAILLKNTYSLCADKKTCSDCIQELECNWCAEKNPNDTNHCFNLTESYNCTADKIIAPKFEAHILSNKKIQVDANKEFVQIQPQKIRLKLRKSQNYTFQFKYAQAFNYPIDLYYIMDLSNSMKESKSQLANVGEKIINTMKNITKNFHIGFGSFVDKTDLPFVNTVPERLASPCEDCVPAYDFKNHLSLSDDENFSREVRNAQLSGNLDTPEGGFDALMQAMVCEKEIGWRKEARRIIVFSTDADFHIAGDGKLAGIVEPNDAKCHMKDNKYTGGLQYDYPSISQINYIAKTNKFYILFVVTKEVELLYNYLTQAIEEAKVDLLADTSDIVGIIEKYYKGIQNNIQLKVTKPNNVKVTISSNDCKFQNYLTCPNVTPGKELIFDVNVKATDCNESRDKNIIRIQPGQLPESLEIEVEVECECNCNDKVANAEECQTKGDLECGVCNCGKDHFGKTCECTRSTRTLDVSSCRLGDNFEVCSGRGQCICGECTCRQNSNPNEIISGDYCECDNFSCPKNAANEICNNRGKCVCGKCQCDGFSGEDCSCSNSNETCIFNNEVCSGQGTCTCSECQCIPGHYGKFCEECANCEAKQCLQLQPCVECTLFQKGIYKDECEVACSAYTITQMPSSDFNLEQVKECRNPTDEYCFIEFKYIYINNRFYILGNKELQCSQPLNVVVLVFSVIGAILLIGLLTLIIWKLAVTVHDRREYANFINEREKSKWSRGENPLFKHPVTSFRNPTYGQEREADE